MGCSARRLGCGAEPHARKMPLYENMWGGFFLLDKKILKNIKKIKKK